MGANWNFIFVPIFLEQTTSWAETLAVEDKVLNIFGDATHVAVWRRRPLDSEQEGVQSAVASQKLVQLVFGADLIENLILKVPNDFKHKKLAEWHKSTATLGQRQTKPQP